jgi:hypothetical protein
MVYFGFRLCRKTWGHIATFNIWQSGFNSSRSTLLRFRRFSNRRIAIDTARYSVIPAAAANSPSFSPHTRRPTYPPLGPTLLKGPIPHPSPHPLFNC